MGKFKMELTWHNCKTHPPKEEGNNFLIVTDGDKVFNAIWNITDGYYIKYDHYCIPLPHVVLEDWWWADIAQTVQQTPKFQDAM